METDAKRFKRTKLSCYFSYISTASAFALPALLFVTFHEKYDISFTLLGTLVLVNFCTQLGIDLVFSFFSRFFNLKWTVRLTPLVCSLGLLFYALAPFLFPNNVYVGLLLGTIIFSVAAGLSEVLISPTVAAIPSKTPDRDMSFLHSLYAWGLVGVILFSTLFLKLFGRDNWMYLTMILAALPVFTFILFTLSPMPNMDVSGQKGEKANKKRVIGLTLCVACIFLGSAAENGMTNWISGFIETTLGVDKVWGDIFGMALFAILLGLTRVAYAKYGKNISTVLLFGMIGSVVCYLVAGLSPNNVVALCACVLTGICTSMLWPGTLILMEESYPGIGVSAYALMAAGGDFGASLSAQLIGAVTDRIALTEFAADLAQKLASTPEEIGMKVAMIITAIFPVLGTVVVLVIRQLIVKKKTLI
ncbi:MAG: MFS transporter [Clostridia bacterium]|nr:MFS transporter [Clostridia bacterium]